jgi:hypothetical protein
MERGRRRTRPTLERLEGRRLLNAKAIGPDGQPINDKDLARHRLQRTNGVPLADRQIRYTTPEGTKVFLTLYGVGSLAGTTHADGVLDLVYDKTNAATRIIATTVGGTGRARLGSVHDADVDIGDLSGVGGNLVGLVSLPSFDLVDGAGIDDGRINLTGGVGRLVLGSAGPGTQIHLRESPPVINADLTATSSGRTLQYANADKNGGLELTGVSGLFVPERVNLVGTQPEGKAGPPPAPPGLRVEIDHIDGAPQNETPLGPPQVFGLDPTANALIRFNATSGLELGRIELPEIDTTMSGVGLGRYAGRLVALVGVGTTVLAFDAVSGTSAGQFTVGNLMAAGLTAIDGIGSTDTRTVLVGPAADGTGRAQVIDVTRSISSGQAVAVGNPFTPMQEFELAGGLSGVAGSRTIYATGAAHFDTSQPDRFQAGVLALDASGVPLRETTRVALKDQMGSFIDAGPTGTAPSQPVQALGSIDARLARVDGIATDMKGVSRNTVSLLNPQNLAGAGTITLNSPNLLSGLSESFHPELVGAALIDVQGNIQSFRARSAQGLVLNDAGNLNLVQIQQATNSVIAGFPFGHVAIARRSKVQILSSKRGLTDKKVVDRGEVTVDLTLRPIGPLSLP